MATDLYPDLAPFATGRLDVGDGHSLYWEQAGAKDGRPVVFLHGGPGASCQPVHRRFFDPRFYRIILFDQRGCGRSTPHGSVHANTTSHLIADLEKLRHHLAIGRWLIFGGSWGSTLGLAYGIAHPTVCAGFVLRGIFLARPREIDWFLHGMGGFFPEAHAAFAAGVPLNERDDLLAAYYRRLTDADPDVAAAAGAQWSAYEARCSLLTPKPAAAPVGKGALALARLEAHYIHHGCFLPASADPRGYLIAGTETILARHPGQIIQRRYDIICPPRTAYELAEIWPAADLTLVPAAGHSALDPNIRSGLVQATETMKKRAVY